MTSDHTCHCYNVDTEKKTEAKKWGGNEEAGGGCRDVKINSQLRAQEDTRGPPAQQNICRRATSPLQPGPHRGRYTSLHTPQSCLLLSPAHHEESGGVSVRAAAVVPRRSDPEPCGPGRPEGPAGRQRPEPQRGTGLAAPG